MKIVVLGAKGNLGSQLVPVLQADHEVYAFDYEDFDVLDFERLYNVLVDILPALVINTVAYNKVDSCEEGQGYDRALLLNRDLPAFLAETALRLKFTLAQYSTDYVFSGSKEYPAFAEEDIPNPINKYGESKFLGEQEILKLKNKGLNYYIIRTSKLFGPSPDNQEAKPSFFSLMLASAQEQDELRVVNEELSCFTYTPDLAIASARLLIAQPGAGIYHLVNENPATWYEAVVELFSLAKREVNIRAIRSEDLARPARRPKYSVLQNNKLKKLRPYQEALKEYLRTII